MNILDSIRGVWVADPNDIEYFYVGVDFELVNDPFVNISGMLPIARFNWATVRNRPEGAVLSDIQQSTTRLYASTTGRLRWTSACMKGAP